jgi:O-6-methylguanine DNA methyltransferase
LRQRRSEFNLKFEGRQAVIHVFHLTRFRTPLGRVVAVSSPHGLVWLEFAGPGRRAALEARLRRLAFPYELREETDEVLLATPSWLSSYFAGRFSEAPRPPLDLPGTAFEQRVWKALLEVPAGTTRSYGDLARRLGIPSAARAVGGAVGRNPVSLVVPCHRIIGADGSLTGYGGGLDRKSQLLRHERASYGVGNHRVAPGTAAGQRTGLRGARR